MGNYIYWLGAADQADPTTISPSQSQLSSLAQFGFPVLPGFILNSEALVAMLDKTKLQKIDWSNAKTITAASKTISGKIKSTGLPSSILTAIEEAYEQLFNRIGLTQADVLIQVAVAGQSNSIVQVPERIIVKKKSQLKSATSELYAGLFAAKNLSPHTVEDWQQGRIGLSLLFQVLLPSTAAGTLEGGNSITIKAIYGRPEPLLQSQLAGDRYIVDSQTLSILSRDLNRQEWRITHLADKAKHQKVPSLDQTAQKIDDDQILDLAKWAISLGDHGDLLPALEWQIDHSDRIWITSVLGVAGAAHVSYNLPTDPDLEQKLATGHPLVIGTAVGPVRLLKNRHDLASIEEGDILLSETADLIPNSSLDDVLGKIGGWLIESGQVKPMIVESLEAAGVPLIRHAGLAHTLQSGTLVTIDGQSGSIYRGRVKPRPHLANLPAVASPTATKLFIKPTSLATLDEELALPSDGIGWLSARTLLETLGQHPRASLEKSSRLLLTQSIDQLCQVAAACRPRPVIYTINDLTSDQYRQLEGGEIHEKEESNPLLGYRGAHRSLREPDLLRLEFEAVRRVREDYGFDNLHLMLPFVRTMTEFTAVYHLALGSGLRPGRDFQIWLLCQVPANLLLLPELVEKQLIQGICLDLDSLTQLLLGVDHANPKLIDEFDVRDQTVMTALSQAINTAREAGLPATAVGRSLEQHPEVIEALVAAGVTGLVVEPTDLRSLRQLAASAEQRLILDRVLDL